MRRLLILLSFLVLPFLVASQEMLYRKKVDPSVMTTGVLLKKSTVQIEVHCKHGNNVEPYGATGFLVSYPDSRLPNGSFFKYLVTNRHVAECRDDQNHSPQQIYVITARFNLHDGSSKEYPLDCGAWHFSTDDSVDLAVMPISPPNDAEFVFFPTTEFATKDYVFSHRITEGSPIILSGYFYQFSGQQKFQAIVREGILSMMPDEPMETLTGKPGSLYLADVHIFGGNSGSPVLGEGDALDLDGFKLLGVVSGYYYEESDFSLKIATTAKGAMHANSGVAIIVPIDYLKTMLDAPDLKALRENYFLQTIDHAPVASKP